MAQEDNLHKLYINLTDDGYNLGTEDEFRKRLQNKATAEKFHQNMVDDGYQLGSFDEFVSMNGLSYQMPQSKLPADVEERRMQTARVPKPGERIEATHVDTQGNVLQADTSQLVGGKVATVEIERPQYTPSSTNARYDVTKESAEDIFTRRPNERGELRFGWQRGQRVKGLDQNGVWLMGATGGYNNDYFLKAEKEAESMSDEELVDAFNSLSRQIGKDRQALASTPDGFQMASQLKAYGRELRARDVGLTHGSNIREGDYHYHAAMMEPDIADEIAKQEAMSWDERLRYLTQHYQQKQAADMNSSMGLESVGDRSRSEEYDTAILAATMIHARERGILPEKAYDEIVGATQNNIPTETGVWSGFKQSLSQMGYDIQHFWGEVANVVAGSRNDITDAITALNKYGDTAETTVLGLASMNLVRELPIIGDLLKPLFGDVDYPDGDLNAGHVAMLLHSVLEETKGADGHYDIAKANKMLENMLNQASFSYGDRQIRSAAYGTAYNPIAEGNGAWVGQQLAQMIPSATAILVGVTTKNPTIASAIGNIGMGAMTLSSAGSAMREARQYGASESEIWATGIANGFWEWATEKIPFDRYTKRVFGSVRASVAQRMMEAVGDSRSAAAHELNTLLKAVKKDLGGSTKDLLKAYTGDVLAEGSSEFAAGALQKMCEMIYKNPEDYPTLMEILNDGWEGAKGGAFMGAGMGVLSIGATSAQTDARRKKAGYVSVGTVEDEDGYGELVEILGKDAEGRITIIRGNNTETVDPDQISNQFTFSYNEWKKGEVQRQVDAAHDEGYNAAEEEQAGVKERVDVARAWLYNLGFDDSNIESLNSEEIPETWLDALNDEQRAAVEEYRNAMAAYDGMLQHVQDDVDKAIAESEATVDQQTHADTGAVHHAVLKTGGEVWVVGGNVALTPEGNIDIGNSDGDLIVFDPATGGKRMIHISDLASADEPVMADQLKQEAAATIQETMATDASNRIDGVLPFQPGDEYTLPFGEEQHTITIIGDAGDGVNTVVSVDGGEQQLMPMQMIQEAADAQREARIAEQAAMEAAASQQQPVEQEPEATEEVTEEPVEEEQPDEDAMPMNGDEVDWFATSPERGHRFLYDEAGLSPEEADAVVANSVKDAEKELEKVSKKAPKPGNAAQLNKYRAEKEAHEQQVAAAQAAVDYWKGVQATQQQVVADLVRRQADERAAQDAAARQAAIEAEAQYQAEQEAKTAEQAERGPFTPGQNVIDKWKSAKKIDGRKDVKVLADGTVVAGHYVLHEAGATTPSHDPATGWKPTEGFPVNENGGSVNDRDYERDRAAQEITIRMSETFDGRAYQDVPIISDEGIDYSGNGRTIAGDMAARNNTDGAYLETARQYSEKYGFTAEDMDQFQHPRVDFMLDKRLPYTPEVFAKFNAQEMKGQNLTESAVKLGKTVDDTTFNDIVGLINQFDTMSDFYADGTAPAEAISMLLRAGVITPMQHAQMFDGDSVSGQGKEMLENLLLGKAFEGNPEAIRQIRSMPSVRQQIVGALAEVANNSTLGDYSLEDVISQAVALVHKARNDKNSSVKQGDSVSDYARQLSLFPNITGGATIADLQNTMVLLLGDILNGRGQLTFKNVLIKYNYSASQTVGYTGSFFTDASPEGLLKDAIQLINNSNKNEIKQEITAAVEQRKSAARQGSEPVTAVNTGDEGGAAGSGAERDKNTVSPGLIDPRTMSDEERQRRGDMLRNAPAIEVEANQIVSTQEQSARKAAEAWWDNNVGEPHWYDTEVGEVEINRNSVESSLAHGYGQMKLDAITSLIDGFGNAVYLGTMPDGTRQESVQNHYFAYPIMYNGKRCYVFCRALHDNNTNRLYVHEVFVEEGIKKGNTLQTAASQPHGGIALYRDILGNVLDPEKEVYTRPALEPGTNTDPSGVDSGLDEGVTAPAGNSPQTSEGKGSTENANVQGNSKKNVDQSVSQAEAEVDTEPTDGQKEAGNYKKGHVKIDGFDVTIEQPKGSVRSGVDASGKAWSQEMHNTYGYIRGTEGVDGDHIDVFLSDHLDSWNGMVYVVDQVNKDGSFDEHKVMYGFDSEQEARDAYLSNYEEGWTGLGNITGVTRDEFKKWVDSSHRKTKPFAEYKSVKVSRPIQGLEGYTEDEILADVRAFIEQQLEDAGIEGVTIKGMALHGSRMRGDARPDSDLDVVVEYEGDISEDAFFNLVNYDLNFRGPNGIIVDINPITRGKSGTLEQYMERSRRYDEEKQNADKAGAHEIAPQAENEMKPVEEPSLQPYTITPTKYTTKKGKELDVWLVKFDGEIDKQQATDIAKETRGWWDREQGGFLMRSEEAARDLAERVAGATSQSDAIPEQPAAGNKPAKTSKKPALGSGTAATQETSSQTDVATMLADEFKDEITNASSKIEIIPESADDGPVEGIANVTVNGQASNIWLAQGEGRTMDEHWKRVFVPFADMDWQEIADLADAYNKAKGKEVCRDDEDAKRINFGSIDDAVDFEHWRAENQENLSKKGVKREEVTESISKTEGNLSKTEGNLSKTEGNLSKTSNGGKVAGKSVGDVGKNRIDDFGEKIGGARKDVARGRIRDAKKMSVKDLTTLKKGADEILSQANILRLYKDGQMDEVTARQFMALNNVIKSVLSSGLLKNIRGIALEKYRDAAVAWEEGKPFSFDITDGDLEAYRLTRPNASDEKARASLVYHITDPLNMHLATYEALNYPAEERKIGRYVIVDYSKMQSDHVTLRRHIWVKNGYSAHRGYPFDNLKDAVTKMKALCPVVEAKAKKARGEKAEHGLHVTKEGYGYYIKSRNIPGNIYLSPRFSTEKQAKEYLENNLDRLKEREQRLVDALMGSNIGMAEREGVDYRNGKDVTPQDFLDEFGFRGVEFGNWVPQGERQMYLNKTYDAIKDFCAIVGISPKAFSLGGRLGLAFGARGHSRAMAHYEPAKEVINLTRMSGVGSLAHEWFHAIDNYLAKQKTGNMSDMATVTHDVVRDELSRVFKDMYDAMRSMDYHRRSRSAGEYWGRTEEEFARLFENYIYNKLSAKEATSPVLVRKDVLLEDVEEQLRGSWPYPSAEENAKMESYFDNLFNTIQEKTDEHGNVVLFQKAEGSTISKEVDAVEAALRDALIDELREAGIEVVTDNTEAQSVLKAEYGRVKMMGFANSREEFDKTRERAVAEVGIVMPGLAENEVVVVDVPRHDFTGSNPIKQAEVWGKKNLVTPKDESGNYIDRPKLKDGTEYSISSNAVGKFLSKSATKGSDNLGVHLSVLKKLKDVIRESIEAEVHPDYKKDDTGKRDPKNGYNLDYLVHRLYGAVDIDGKTYRVKTTIIENGNESRNYPHSYEVTKIELLDDSMAGSGSRSVNIGREDHDTKNRLSNNSIAGAKLLQDVEKSYDPGKKLLDESKKNVKEFRTEDGEAYGFTYDGDIYVDPEIATSETPVHEYSHLWAGWLKKANPKAWARLCEVILKQEDVLDYVKRLYPELEGDDLVEEVFTHYSGRRGAERLRREEEAEMAKADGIFNKARIKVIFDQIRQALSRFWEMSRDLFAGNVDGIEKLSAEDFADMALADLLGHYNGNKAAVHETRREAAPTFYSNAERAVEGVKQNKAKAEQWKAMLTKAGGIKSGEDKWMGLSQWLDEHKGETLTKDEVLQFVRDNGIQMEENIYGELQLKSLQQEFDEIYDGIVNGVEGEEVVTFPKQEAWGELRSRYHGGDDFDMAFSLDNRMKIQVDDEDRAGYFLGTNPISLTRLDYTTEGLENKREIAFVVPDVEPYQESDEVHFGPENQGRAVMWVRFGETTDTDGNRVLVIDEIQSNRHQDGRARGYRTEEAVKEDLRLQRAVDRAQDRYDNFTRRMGDKYNGVYEDIYADMTDAERAEAERLERAVLDASEAYNNQNYNDVPAAPFEKNWHEVAMKRMLRLAAEEGFDKVAWTTGAQQAERYNIGNVVKEIDIKPYPGSKARAVTLFQPDGEFIAVPVDENGIVEVGMFGGHRLEDVVGKELANKIYNTEENTTISGEGLRLGGEGMKGFYDQMLPRFMDKYGKKWGVQTGEVTLNTPGQEVMHSVDVNEDMRRSVLENGQPLFQKVEDDVRVDNAQYNDNTDARLRDVLSEGGSLAIMENKGKWRIEGMPGEFNTRYSAIDEWRERAAGNVMWYFSEDGNSIIVEGEGDLYETMSRTSTTSDRRYRERLARQQEARVKRGRQMVDELAKKLGITVRYVDDMSADERAALGERKLNSKGWYSPRTGEVYINLGRHTRLYDMEATFLHEVVAHKGLRRLFGKDFDTFIDNVYNNVNKGIRAEIDRMAEQQKSRAADSQRARHDDEHWRRVATEEYMAKLAERLDLNHPEQLTLWQKIKGFLIEALRKVGVKSAAALDDNDLRGILWESYHSMEAEGALGYAKGRAFRDQMEREAAAQSRQSRDTGNLIAAENEARYTGSLFDMLPQIGAWERMMSAMSERELFSEIAKDGPDMTSNYTEEYDKRHIKDYNRACDEIQARLERELPYADRLLELLQDATRQWEDGAYKDERRSGVLAAIDTISRALDEEGAELPSVEDESLYRDEEDIAQANEKVNTFKERYNIREDIADIRPIDGEDALNRAISEQSLNKNEAKELRAKFDNPESIAVANAEKGFVYVFTHKIKDLNEVDLSTLHELVHIAYPQLSQDEIRRFTNAIVRYYRSYPKGDKFINKLHASYDSKDWATETMAYFIEKRVKKHGWEKLFSGEIDFGNEEINNFVRRIHEILTGNGTEGTEQNGLGGAGSTRGGSQRGNSASPGNQGGLNAQLSGMPDDDVDVDGFDAGRMTFEESITAGMLKASADNRAAVAARTAAMRALGGNLSKLRQAMARQREYDRGTVDSIVRLARSVMESGYFKGFSPYEVKRLMSLINHAAGREDITRQAGKVVDLLLKHQLLSCEVLLHDQMRTRGSKINASGVEVQAGLDIEGQRMVAAMKYAINLDPDAMQERIWDALDRMGSADQALADVAAAEYQGLLLAQQYIEDIKGSKQEENDLRYDLQQAEDDMRAGTITREQYRQYVAETENAIRENRLERVGAYDQLTTALGAGLGASVQRAKEWREMQKERVNEIRHNANSDLEGVPADEHVKPTWMQQAANWSIVRFFMKPLANFDYMLRMLGRKNVNGEGYLWQRFMGGWTDAADREWRNLKAAHKVLDEKVSEVFGKDMRWSDLFTLERKLPGMDVSFWDAGEEKVHTLSQGNMLYIYMVNKMGDGRMKLRKMGITEEDVETIRQRLDPRFIQLADWLQEDFLVNKRNDYNAVYQRMFGASMAAIEHYFPLKINSRSRGQEEDLNNESYLDDNNIGSTITGSIIKRKRNSLPLDVTGADAFDVVLGHLQDMEHWAAFAEFNRDLNTLLSYKRFRNRLLNMSSIRFGSGKTLWMNFKRTCAIASGAYRPKMDRDSVDTTLINVAKGVTAAKISFRLYTALKQLLSYPAYLSEASGLELIKSSNPIGAVKAWNWALAELPGFAQRWQSRQAGDSRLRESDADWGLWRNKIVSIANRWGMSPNAAIDGLTVAMGAKAIYESKLKRYRKAGYTDEQAKRRALRDASISYNETQQSNANAYLSAMQLDRSAASVALTVFRNASMGYQRRLFQSIANLKHIFLTPGYKEQALEFMTKQMVRDGLDEVQAQQAAARVYRRATYKNLADFAIFGWVMQMAWNLGPYLPYLLMGDDDDDKKKMLDDAAMHALAGGIEGLSGGNVMSDTYNAFRSGQVTSYMSTELLPLMSDIEDLKRKLNQDMVEGAHDLVNLIVQAGVGVNPQQITDWLAAGLDVADGDPEIAHEFGMFVLRFMSVPQSQIDKLYIDELGLTARDAQKLNAGQMAERYARYKMRRGSMYTSWAYSDEDRQKAEERYMKRFETKTKERVAELDDAQLEDNFNTDDATRRKLVSQETTKRVKAKVMEGVVPAEKGDDEGEWKKVYERKRDYTDLAQDILLTATRSRAKKEGDTNLDKAIAAAQKELTTIKKGKHTKTIDEPGLGEGFDDEVMERLRERRKELLSELGIM